MLFRSEYTVEIDGQVLRYRQGAANWQPFVWPGPGTPGVRITGMTFDGRQLSFFNEPGRFGLEKMINSAQRRRIDGQVFELKWPQSDVAVVVQLRILSNSAPAAQPAPAAAGEPGAKPGALPALVAGSDEATPLAPAAPAAPQESPTATLPAAPAPVRQGAIVAAGEGA